MRERERHKQSNGWRRRNVFCIIMAAAQNNSLKTNSIKAKRTVVFCLFFSKKNSTEFWNSNKLWDRSSLKTRSNIWKEKEGGYKVDIVVPGFCSKIQKKWKNVCIEEIITTRLAPEIMTAIVGTVLETFAEFITFRDAAKNWNDFDHDSLVTEQPIKSNIISSSVNCEMRIIYFRALKRKSDLKFLERVINYNKGRKSESTKVKTLWL